MSTEIRPSSSRLQATVVEPAKADSADPGPMLVVPPECYPKVDDLVTEDDTPMDNMFSEKQQRLLTESLYTSWKPPRTFLVTANVGLLFTPSEPPWVPDVLLSLDSVAPSDFRPKESRSYFVWEYGKPPSLVVEIVSNKVGGEDSEKLAGYCRLGIAYYTIYDPFALLSDQVLRVYSLVGANYELMKCDSEGRYVFPGLDLGVCCWQGSYEGCDTTWLRWLDLSGNLVPTGAESLELEKQRADSESQRADSEKQRADSEKQRADAERQRAEKLAEKLRELGLSPDV